MPAIEIDDALWTKFSALCDQLGVRDRVGFLHDWCRRIIHDERVAEGRYLPVALAIVTRDDAEVLLVGSEYNAGQPLTWNLPGGAVRPGEDLCHAVARELREETGIEMLRVGRLAWVVQSYAGPDATGLLVCAFEVAAWRGEVTPVNQEIDGHVRRAAFLPYVEACERLMPGSVGPMRDWFAAPGEAPRVYWKERDGLPGEMPALNVDPGRHTRDSRSPLGDPLT